MDFKCQSFSYLRNLKIYIKTLHADHNDNKCKYCGKSFSTARSMEKHIHTVHEGQKDFKCESCGKSFSQTGDLKQ